MIKLEVTIRAAGKPAKQFEIPNRSLFCSFCGKEKREIAFLIEAQGKGVRICDECVGLCSEIIAKAKTT